MTNDDKKKAVGRLRKALIDQERAEKEVDEAIIAAKAEASWEQLREGTGREVSSLRSLHYRALNRTNPEAIPPSLRPRLRAGEGKRATPRPPREYTDGSIGVQELADRLGISRATVMRRLNGGTYGEPGVTSWYREEGAKGAIRFMPELVEELTAARSED